MSGFGDDLIRAMGEALEHAKGEGPAVAHETTAPREVREAAQLTVRAVGSGLSRRAGIVGAR
jgi:putative transcriptional regulator